MNATPIVLPNFYAKPTHPSPSNTTEYAVRFSLIFSFQPQPIQNQKGSIPQLQTRQKFLLFNNNQQLCLSEHKD